MSTKDISPSAKILSKLKSAMMRSPHTFTASRYLLPAKTLSKLRPTGVHNKYIPLSIGMLIILVPVLVMSLRTRKVSSPSSLFGFNEGYGDTVHDTENLATGTITNAAWKPESDCLSGNCLFFDGSGDYVSFGDTYDFSESDNWSIDFWFRTTDISSGTRTFVSKYLSTTGTDGGYKIYMNSTGTITFAIDDDNTWEPEDYVTSTLAYDDNKWHHLEVTKSGTSDIKLYINAELIGQDSTISSTGTLANTDNFYVGIDNSGLSNPYTGFIDELKIHTDDARSAEEVKTDYIKSSTLSGLSAKFGPDSTYLTDGLVGYWKLDEYSSGGTAITRYDGSGNTNTLSDYNTVSSNTGKFGLSADFNAANEERLDIPSNSRVSVSDEDLTISAWVYLDLKASNRAIVSKYRTTTNAREFILFYNAATDRLAFSASANGETETTVNANTLGSPSTATWYHVVGWHDSTNNRIGITINGSYTDTVSHSGGINSGGQNLIIGAYRSSGINYEGFFDGRIDEVRMYKKLLSLAQLRSLCKWVPGPVGWYKMDDAKTSQLTDYSGGGYHGSISGYSESLRVPGIFGKGLESKGNVNGPEITIPYANNLIGSSASNSFTLETYVYLTNNVRASYPWTSPIVSRYGLTNNSGCSTPGGLSVRFQSDSARISRFFLPHDNSGSSCDSGTEITGVNLDINRWNHISATFDAPTKTMKLYTNGVLSGTNAWGGSSSWSWQDNTMYINNNNDLLAVPAIFDEVKFYNYVRDSGQIVEDMNAGHPVPGSPVGSATAYWPLNEGTGTTAYDFGTSNVDLTLSSERWTSSGKYDMAFDGDAGERLVGTNSSSLAPGVNEDFSVSAWFKSDIADNTTTQYLISKGGSGKGGYQIYFLSDDTIVCGIDDDNNSFPEDTVQSEHDYYDMSWHQIQCIRDVGANSLYLYIDGALEDTDSNLSSSHSLDTDTIFYANDEDNLDNGNEFTGDIDEIKLYRLALTNDQAKTEYNRGMVEVFGALSTDASGNPSNAADDSYCPPGQGSECPPPVAHWKFDENRGTGTSDISGHNNDSTTWSGNTRYETGKFGSALSFDGDDDVVRFSETPFTDLADDAESYTISAWVKTGSSDLSYILAKSGGSGTTPFRLYINSGTSFMVISGSSASTATSTLNIWDNNWHHIAGVRDVSSDSLLLYIDGLFSASITDTTTGTLYNDYDISVGNGGTSYLQYDFDGLIDDTRIYNYARSPSQIAWDYNLGEPVAWYKFDECTGTTAYNYALNSSGKAMGSNGAINIGAGGNYTSEGTCSGTATEAWKAGAVGKFGSSLGFDDNDDYVIVPDNLIFDLTTGLSISAWVKTSENENNNVIISKGSSYEIGVTADGSVYWEKGGEQVNDGSAKVTSGTWHHVVVTNNDTNVTYYVDGLQTNTAGSDVNVNNSNDFRIGTNTVNYFDGLIDDVRVYPYPVNAYQVRTLYNGGAAVRF